MAASSTDKFTSASNGTRPSPTTLTGTRAVAATSISCAALTGWPTATAVHFIIYTTDTSGNKVAGSQLDCKGVVSGTSITNITYKAGNDTGNSIGAIVEAAPTAAWADDIVAGITAHANQDGTLKAGAVNDTTVLASDVVTTAKILDSNVTTAKIADNNVTAAKLATSAITLGYTAITANTAALANNTTLGLATTVTIPAGGRKIRITAFCQSITGSANLAQYGLCIWDGTVGSGTALASGYSTAHAANAQILGYASAIITPAAGSKTYNVGMFTNSGTGTVQASATAPAYLLVEAI
jgi:hypothetical protein